MRSSWIGAGKLKAGGITSGELMRKKADNIKQHVQEKMDISTLKSDVGVVDGFCVKTSFELLPSADFLVRFLKSNKFAFVDATENFMLSETTFKKTAFDDKKQLLTTSTKTVLAPVDGEERLVWVWQTLEYYDNNDSDRLLPGVIVKRRFVVKPSDGLLTADRMYMQISYISGTERKDAIERHGLNDHKKDNIERYGVEGLHDHVEECLGNLERKMETYTVKVRG